MARFAALAVIREIGGRHGRVQHQFAIDPKKRRDGSHRDEPRVSRSSALASQATASPSPRVAPSWRSATTSTRSPTTSPRDAGVRGDHRTTWVTKAPASPSRNPRRGLDPGTADESVGESHGHRPHVSKSRWARRCARWRSDAGASTSSASRRSRICATDHAAWTDRLWQLAGGLRLGMTVDGRKP